MSEAIPARPGCLRDRGFDFHGSGKYRDNLLARGFEFVAEQLAAARSDTVIFTTVLHAGEPPPAGWRYYSLETGQHIAFFLRRSLEAPGAKLGLRYQRAGPLHLLTARPLPGRRLRFRAGRALPLAARIARRRPHVRALGDHELILKRLREGRPPDA